MLDPGLYLTEQMFAFMLMLRTLASCLVHQILTCSTCQMLTETALNIKPIKYMQKQYFNKMYENTTATKVCLKLGVKCACGALNFPRCRSIQRSEILSYSN